MKQKEQPLAALSVFCCHLGREGIHSAADLSFHMLLANLFAIPIPSPVFQTRRSA